MQSLFNQFIGSDLPSRKSAGNSVQFFWNILKMPFPQLKADARALWQYSSVILKERERENMEIHNRR